MYVQVRERDFLDILGKETDAVFAEVENGRYPPCIRYQVLYTGGVAERRRSPALWGAELQGADVKLFFSCKVLQELGTHTHVILALRKQLYSEHCIYCTCFCLSKCPFTLHHIYLCQTLVLGAIGVSFQKLYNTYITISLYIR